VRRLLILTGLAALASFAFAASASADVSTQHFLTMYKVEQHVDLQGEFPNQAFHEHNFCNAGDYAVDGMWRIDHVDQANPQTGDFGDASSVQIDASYGDDVNPAKWHFRGFNNATGRAQLKLFTTCLGNTTTNVAGHSHNITLSNRFDDPHPALPNGPNEFDHANTCPAGQIPVAPGFNFTAADPGGGFAGSGRVYRSWPTASLQGWHWAFLVSNGPSDLTVYLRCLTIKTAAAGAGPHAHNIIYNWHDGYGGILRHQPVSNDQGFEQREDCGDHEKGLLGAFWINDPFHVYYLGMDPRIKQRAFRFWNQGGGDDGVYVNALCVNDRVGKQIAP
jgi:hypothetical protein